MRKKDILNKIKNAILGEASTTPGITVTNKTKGTEKKFNDEYYKESNKKFKDYLGIKKDDFDAPKVNADKEQEKSYGGSGMEGLTYDNEGTEVSKKFTKRVEDLNKPSKDYYLKKDEVNDVYSKLKKKSSDYKKDKDIFQNTKPVRAIKAKTKNESTIKRLTYKTEFINESSAIKLIPTEFKKDNMVFEMTDGNKLIKVRWEGGEKGRAVILLSKDNKKISQELSKMHHLFEYNSRETLGKTNLINEEVEFKNIVSKVKSKDETLNNNLIDKTDVKKTSTGDEIEYDPKTNTWNLGFNLKNLTPDVFREKIISFLNTLPGYGKGETTSVGGGALMSLRNAVKKQLGGDKLDVVNQLNLDIVRRGN